ncbi:MAG TPA: hypothetical protein VM490_19035 [Armatimonadaceae bacterium]|nr:hypothetical protein [Armatimonadaceae bacterium]
MYYIDAARGSAIIPKLVGSYEAELLPVWEGLALRPPDLIVDVGCAEGYYAVGLARLFGTPTRVLAYDVDPISRTLCSELARKNDVADRVTIRTECNHRELRSILQPGTFILCDCEGYEKELLDPGEVPELVNAEILVELHDAFIPGIKEAMIDRFSRTHRINLIESRERDPADYPVIAFLTPEEQGLALSEFRGGRQEWAHLVPLAQPGTDVSSRVPG